jgi:branched-chain amino acid transport system ATP-binding protein
MDLDVAGLSVTYGAKEVVHDISFSVSGSEAVSLLGHNGAGKTSALRAVMGLVRSSASHIRLDGNDIASLSTEQRLHRGLCYVEPRGVFPRLRVHENLVVAARALTRSNVPSRISRAMDLFPEIATKARQPAGELSGGQRQMLSLAMATVLEPRLLMLDEPLLGLAPAVATRVADLLQSVSEALGCSVLLVEQNVRFALARTERCYVLRAGAISWHGNSRDLAAGGDYWALL